MSADAIILIPGIKGNHLVDVNTHDFQPVWRDVRYNFQRVEDLILTGNNNGTYYDEQLNVIINPGQVESLAYKEFMDDLDTDLPKYYFTYDWRLSNRDNAKRLKEFIELLKKKSKAIKAEFPKKKEIKKVNIVTHSMGNHICRFYVNDFGFKSIHKLVFITPPFLGSLAMVDAFITGQGWFNMKKRTRQVVKTFPGAIELLPRYKHAAVFEDGEVVDFFNIKHWQTNVTSSSNKEIGRLNKRFKENLLLTKSKLEDLDKWQEKLTSTEKNRILVIVRDEFKTLQAVKVKRKDGGVGNVVDFRYGLKNDEGDKVVAHASSCCYCKDFETLAVEDAFRYDDDSHAFFLTEERVQLLVSWFFDDSRNLDHHIPGNSVKKVVDIVTEEEDGFKYTKIVKE